LGGPASALTPPINCRAARTTIEREVCQSPELVALDREIAALYDRGLAAFPPADRHRLAQSQLAFLHKREGCQWAMHHSAHPGPALSECTRTSMDERVRLLRHIVDRGGYGH
jgi:uncharacterized protein YecT (DUF1311 family)